MSDVKLTEQEQGVLRQVLRLAQMDRQLTPEDIGLKPKDSATAGRVLRKLESLGVLGEEVIAKF